MTVRFAANGGRSVPQYRPSHPSGERLGKRPLYLLAGKKGHFASFLSETPVRNMRVAGDSARREQQVHDPNEDQHIGEVRVEQCVNRSPQQDQQVPEE